MSLAPGQAASPVSTRSNQKFPKGSGTPTSISDHSQSLLFVTVPQSGSLISVDICLSIADSQLQPRFQEWTLVLSYHFPYCSQSRPPNLFPIPPSPQKEKGDMSLSFLNVKWSWCGTVFRLWRSDLLKLDWLPLASYFLPVNCRPGVIGQDVKNESRNLREPRIFHDTARGGSKAPAEQSILWGYGKNLCPCSILEAWISGRPELRPLVSDLYPFIVLLHLFFSCWTTKFCCVGF
jgi:hypothetical protein